MLIILIFSGYSFCTFVFTNFIYFYSHWLDLPCLYQQILLLSVVINVVMVVVVVVVINCEGRDTLRPSPRSLSAALAREYG